MLFKDQFKQELDKKIKGCDYCKLCDRPGKVPGYGSLDAGTMIIGTCPDETEASKKIPFIGKAKDSMVNSIQAVGFEKNSYYLTYLLKCNPEKRDSIDGSYIKKCMEHLKEEIQIVNPKVLVALGFYVVKYLIEEYELTELKGKKMSEINGNAYVIPAKTFYNAKFKKKQPPRPKRYFIPTYDPASDIKAEVEEFKTGILTVKSVHSLGILLFD